MEETAPAVTEAWTELLVLARDETGDRHLLERLLDLWRDAHGKTAVALYLEKGEVLEREAWCGREALPHFLDGAGSPEGAGSLLLPFGRLLFSPAFPPGAAEDGSFTSEPLTLLLAASLKSARLRHELKEQQFQVNYRVVELESLYEVGLAVASTLDGERLSEEILWRAVSLLDARRGALYFIEGPRYHVDRTFGGDAGGDFAVDDAELRAFLVDGGPPPARLLPGAQYLLGVPIEIDSSPRGLLVVGDKESRRDVGPFPPSARRTLSLFANQAAIALENARLHLQALEKERLEREMSLASEIQRQILPKGAPAVAGFELAGWNRPARQVGGDYYDLFHLANGKIGLVVGDVSGKGMPAALMVSTLHSALRLLIDQGGFRPELLERLNRHILESSTASKFITMLLAELDPETGTLQYLNAGHNPAYLLRKRDAAGEAEVIELGAAGVPLGLMPGGRYGMQSVMVEPGDLLCIYSDGITECESASGEEFGSTRLIELLKEHREEPLPTLLATIQQATDRFAEGLPQYDDETVVLLRRNALDDGFA